MKKFNFYKMWSLSVTMVMATFLVNCGGSLNPPETPDSGAAVNTTQYTGEFLDGAVGGVTYKAESATNIPVTITGLTDVNGQFKYRIGDTVTFEIGGIKLGSQKIEAASTDAAKTTITPIELTGSITVDDDNVVRMLQLLQSLDADGDHSNGITISETARTEAASKSVDFSDRDFATKNITFDLHTLIKNLKKNDAARLVSKADALVNFSDTINKKGLKYTKPTGYQLAWQDEFSGDSLDASKWTPETGYGNGGTNDGWGNDEWQLYTANSENLGIYKELGEEKGSKDKSYLKITAKCSKVPTGGTSSACGKRDGTITSAKVNTKGKFDFQYGKVEARIKVPTGKGSWPAFWSLGKDFPDTPWPASGEIDFLEVFNTTVDKQIKPSTAVHWQVNPGDKNSLSLTKELESTLDGDQFHIYTVERTADRLVASINGQTYATLTYDVTKDPQTELSNAMYLILNLAMGTDKRANMEPDATTVWPQEMLVDYVRVYKSVGAAPSSVLVDFDADSKFICFNDGTGNCSGDTGFAGGAAVVINNPQKEGNAANKVAQFKKFKVNDTAVTYGGTSIKLQDNAIDFSDSNNTFSMKVYATRAVNVLMQLKGDSNSNIEVTAAHGGTGWETLTFNFTDKKDLVKVFNQIVLIFDNGTMGDAEEDSNKWTFYFDDITLQDKSVTVSKPPSNFDGGLVANGDFENGTTSWIGNAAHVEQVDGSAVNKANVAKSGNPHDVNLSQVLTITPDKTYTLKFKARSDAARTLVAGIGLNAYPWTSKTETVNLTNQWQDFTLPLTSTGFGDSNSRVLFDMGAATGLVLIDNVSLHQADGNNGGSTGAPTVAPTLTNPPAAENVISIFSDLYTDKASVQIIGSTTKITEEDFNGNKVTKLSNLDSYAYTYNPPLDLTGMHSLHFDYWTADSTNLKLVMVSSDPEKSSSFVISVKQDNWQTLNIPLSTFTGDVDLSKVTQAKIEGNGTVYLDNIYFHSAKNATPTITLPINFEEDASAYSVTEFDGGSASVKVNPKSNGINTSGNVLEIIKGSGKAYAGSYITLDSAIDFSKGTTFKVKAWSSQPRKLLLQFSNSGGQPASPNQLEKIVSHSGGSKWEELTYDFSDLDLSPFASNGGAVRVVFIMDNGTPGDGSADWTMYVDDITQEAVSTPTPTPTPTDAPAAPTAASTDVISIYSDAYTDITGVNVDPNWDSGSGTVASVETIASNNVLKLSALAYQGIDFNKNRQDVSGFTNVHIDYWTADTSAFNVFLIDPNGEASYSVSPTTTGSWQSVTIPLSNYSSLDLKAIRQMKIDGGTGGTLYVDNIYFSKVSITPAPTMSLSSTSYANGGAITTTYACPIYGGSNTSPQFSWLNAPAGTNSFALIMDDETSPCGTGVNACVHWGVFNIPSSETAFAEGADVAALSGVVEGTSYNGTQDYAGPCPPQPPSHTYTTTVYALDSSMPAITVNTASNPMTRSEFESTYSSNILGSGSYTGVFPP